MLVLQTLEVVFNAGHISYEMYDTWLRLNSGEYQLGSNPALLELWADRLLGWDVLTEELADKQLKQGARVAARSKDSIGEGREVDVRSSGLDDLLSYKTIGFRFSKCDRGCGGYHVVITNRIPRTRKHLKPLNQAYPWTEFEDKQKTNLDLASLVYHGLTRGHGRSVQEALNVMPVGVNNTLATAIVVAAMGNPEWGRLYQLLVKDRACCLALSSYKTYFKAVSTAVRRLGRWVDGTPLPVSSVAAIAYYELSIGRAANLTDWKEEVAKRCGPKLPLKDPYTGEDFLIGLKSAIQSIIAELLPSRDVWGSWEDFVAARQKWSPAGSAGGARWAVDGEQIRINKHSFFEATPTHEVLSWLDSAPELRARGSEKLEAGKARAIYGTAPQDQTIITYLISPLERNMGRVREFINGHTGAHEVADIGRRLHNVSTEGVECTMLDFADFNYQHTLEAQHLLFSVIASEVSMFGNADLDRAAAWGAEAQLNQWVKVPDDATWHKVTQGMFSGVRSTDFTNTILNLAYFRAASYLVERHTGLRPVCLMNLHKGDDVWITNRSRLWAIELYSCMARAGFVFQGSKQMFDRERGEFLRVLYTHEGARGYMMRGVATLLIKPIQSVMEMAPQSKASALTSQIHLLYRRGLDIRACETLWWSIVPRALRLKLPGGAGIGIPTGIAMKSFAKGGLDLGPPTTGPVGGCGSRPLPAPIPYTDKLAAAIPKFMSHDWIKVVAAKVGGPFDSAKLEEALHSANVADSLRPEDRKLSMRRLEKDLKAWWASIQGGPTGWAGGRGSLVLEAARDIPVREIGRRLDYALLCYEHAGAEPGAPLNIVDTLMAGIAASPLRDVASAKLALKLGSLAAARACLALAGDRPIARRASLWLESLDRSLGSEITTSILDGIRGVGVSYEAVLHPIVLSLLGKRATDCAILSATQDNVLNRQEWDLWLEKWMASLVGVMITDHSLDEWSHY